MTVVPLLQSRAIKRVRWARATRAISARCSSGVLRGSFRCDSGARALVVFALCDISWPTSMKPETKALESLQLARSEASPAG